MRVLSESYPMNTNVTGFRCVFNLCILGLWAKVASASEGLSIGLKQFSLDCIVPCQMLVD